jgi:hypothetical protein
MNTSLSSLDSLARGAVAERFGTELDTVLRNILDPNTKATAARKITLTVTLKPDDTRSVVAMLVEAKAGVAPALPVTTALQLGVTADGVVMATEIGRNNELPGQIDTDGQEFTPVSAGLTVITGGRAAR